MTLPPVLISPEGGMVLLADGQAKDPASKGPLELPAPTPVPGQLPFSDEKVRLPRMGMQGVLGATPVPTQKELEVYRQFVEGVIDPSNTLDLIQGRARLILLKTTPTRTQIADPSIASFRLLEPQGTQITIIGQRVGTTVLNLWFTDPKNKDKEIVLSYLVRVLPDPMAKEQLEAIYKALEGEINKAFPNSRIRLTLVGDKLMISGQAHDIYDAYQILRLARANAPGAAPGGGGRLPITGLTPTGRPGDPLRAAADTPGIENYLAAGGPNVINNMRVPGEQQISLKVTIAEINRSASRSIGVNYSITNKNGVNVFQQAAGGLITGTVASSGSGADLPINLNNGNFAIALNALRTLNYSRTLAEPILTTMNGQTASFLAGGEFPVPIIGGFGGGGGAGGAGGAGSVSGLQGVEFVPYGVQLTFTPIITDRDRVRLTVSATVSTRDNAAAASIGGTSVPSLNVRTFSTVVELREGQSLAVAGLIENDIGGEASRVPFFGDLPLLGMLSGYNQVSQGERELVVMVTPELVHPLEKKEVTAMPGDDVWEPGDTEFYLLNRLESRRSYDYRSSVRTDIHRMLAYRYCEQYYITGPTGHVEPPDPTLHPMNGKK